MLPTGGRGYRRAAPSQHREFNGFILKGRSMKRCLFFPAAIGVVLTTPIAAQETQGIREARTSAIGEPASPQAGTGLETVTPPNPSTGDGPISVDEALRAAQEALDRLEDADGEAAVRALLDEVNRHVEALRASDPDHPRLLYIVSLAITPSRRLAASCGAMCAALGPRPFCEIRPASRRYLAQRFTLRSSMFRAREVAITSSDSRAIDTSHNLLRFTRMVRRESTPSVFSSDIFGSETCQRGHYQSDRLSSKADCQLLVSWSPC